jgi:hypothetical protein
MTADVCGSRDARPRPATCAECADVMSNGLGVCVLMLTMLVMMLCQYALLPRSAPGRGAWESGQCAQELCPRSVVCIGA